MRTLPFVYISTAQMCQMVCDRALWGSKNPAGNIKDKSLDECLILVLQEEVAQAVKATLDHWSKGWGSSPGTSKLPLLCQPWYKSMSLNPHCFRGAVLWLTLASTVGLGEVRISLYWNIYVANKGFFFYFMLPGDVSPHVSTALYTCASDWGS